jgi:hypothetical protein
MRHVAVSREAEGFAPVWISPAFLARAEVVDGRLRVGDCSASALLIDVNWLDGDALVEVVRLAEAGLPVILRRPPHAPGKRPRGDYEALRDALRALPNVFRRLGDTSLAPLVDGRDLPPFWARRTDEALYLFFAHPKARELRYPMRYGQSLCREPVTRRATVDFEGARHPLDLVFEPYQSLMARVSRADGVQFLNIEYRPPEPTCPSEMRPVARPRG